MKKLGLVAILLMLASLFSCREDIVVDVEEGVPMIGVEASFTDVYKRHEVILRYTADFYNAKDIDMISGARVVVTDGVDTIPFLEQSDQPGHYLTDSVAGRKKTLYRLLVDVPDEGEPDGFLHLSAESYMNDNIEVIDSLVLKQFDLIPGVSVTDTVYLIYPYFQSLPDPSIVYLVRLFVDEAPYADTLTEALAIPMAGYAGYYVNGPEFLQNNMEIAVGKRKRCKMHDGEVIRLDLQSIPMDYMSFIYSLMMSVGSNPLMGPPTNVPTNLQPPGSAVGWFYAASVVSAETVYHAED